MKTRPGENLTAYLFLTPYLALFALFLAVPTLIGVLLSFFDWGIVGSPKWVGLANYAEMIADEQFWNAAGNTLYFVLLTAAPMVVLGLGLAVLLNRRLPGTTLARIAVFAPYVVMVSVVGILWRWVYDTNFGVLNYYLQMIHLPAIAWLTDPRWAMPVVAITSIWWMVGVNAVIYLAGLQDIPAELYEAARIDGATGWASFRRLTIPLLLPVHVFVIPMSVIVTLKVFGQVYVMTNGGPFGKTITLVQYLYIMGFDHFRLGYASAIACVVFALTFALTLLQLKALKAI